MGAGKPRPTALRHEPPECRAAANRLRSTTDAAAADDAATVATALTAIFCVVHRHCRELYTMSLQL